MYLLAGIVLGTALTLGLPGSSAPAQGLEADWQVCRTIPPNPTASIRACSRLIASGSGSPDMRARAYTLRGWSYDLNGGPDAAIRDYDQAISLSPNFALAFWGRANAYHDKGNELAAIGDYDSAIRNDPTFAVAWNGRCWAHAVLGQLDAANRDCDEALRLDPRYAAAFTSRGLIHLKRRQYGLAIRDYSAAIRFAPAMPSAFYCRGIAKRRSGDSSGGDTDIARARSLLPDIANHYAREGIRPGCGSAP